MSIGCRIKSLRTRLGLSIDELADKLDKNRTTVYRYENGDIENLPLGILDSLADLMGWDEPRTVTYNSKLEMEHFERWHEEIGNHYFSNEEHEKLIEYAKFLISQRNK